jgi:hypothetical protein
MSDDNIKTIDSLYEDDDNTLDTLYDDDGNEIDAEGNIIEPTAELTEEEQAAADAAAASDEDETPEEIAAREAADEEARKAAGVTETEEEKATRIAAEEAAKAAETGEEKATREAAEAAALAPGVEQFLSQYGISGGMITFTPEEEGGETTEKHYDDLTPDEQFNVLSDLANKGKTSAEDEFGLDQNEIGLLNFVRDPENGGSVDEAINRMAQQRVDQILALQESENTDYTTMSDDAVVAKWLKENNPEATEEDLAAELERSKESKFYETQASKIRGTYSKDQAAELKADEEAYNAELETEREEDKVLIATAAAEMTQVAGFDIDDKAKNEVLSKLMEVNQHGDPLFMQEVFSDPKKLVEAAWLFYNADNYLNQMVTNHKRELANEYKKGREHSINGMPSVPTGGIGDTPDTKSTPKRTEKVVDIHSLHEDD